MGLITSNSWKQKQSTSDQPLASGCEFHFCVETTFYRTAISIVCTILSFLPAECSLHPVLKLTILSKCNSSVPHCVPEEKFGMGVKVSRAFCIFVLSLQSHVSNKMPENRPLIGQLLLILPSHWSILTF